MVALREGQAPRTVDTSSSGSAAARAEYVIARDDANDDDYNPADPHLHLEVPDPLTSHVGGIRVALSFGIKGVKSLAAEPPGGARVSLRK